MLNPRTQHGVTYVVANYGFSLGMVATVDVGEGWEYKLRYVVKEEKEP